MLNCIPRVEIKRQSSLTLLQSSGAKSNDSAIKFEWNCPVLRTFHVVRSDGILRREKAYISIGFSPELTKRKIMWKAVCSLSVLLRIPCKQQVTCRTLLLSVLWIFRGYSFSSLQKQELCARFWLNIIQCKTAIKIKLRKIWFERKEKFYENNSSVDPFQLVSCLPCKAILPLRSIMLSAKWSLNERPLLDWTNLP